MISTIIKLSLLFCSLILLVFQNDDSPSSYETPVRINPNDDQQRPLQLASSEESYMRQESQKVGRHYISERDPFSGELLIQGNKVTLLINGPATYSARLKAIQDARYSINLEAFSIEDNKLGRKVTDLLIKKQSEGVQVNVMYDSVGSFHAPSSFFERLRKAGVRVLEFNPLNPLNARVAWHPMRRDHRKVLIVDGRVVITGGINFTQDYSTGLFPGEEELRKSKLSWRDTDVQIEGPAAAEFQRTFLDTWKRQKGPPLNESDYIRQVNDEGHDLVGVLASSSGMKEVMYRMYLSAINSA